jgi:transposase
MSYLPHAHHEIIVATVELAHGLECIAVEVCYRCSAEADVLSRWAGVEGSSREMLDGILWIMRTRARRADLPQRLIGDRTYDADPLDAALATRGIEMIAPHRRSRTRPKTQGGQPLRRYKRRWKIDRLFAWLGQLPPVGGALRAPCAQLPRHRPIGLYPHPASTGFMRSRAI